MPAFFKRFERAWANLGPFHALTLFLILAYILYLAVNMAIDGFYLGVALAAVGILLPRLVLTQMVDHAGRVERALNVCWYAVVGVIVLEWTNVISYNAIIALVILFIAPFYLATRFWLISDPRIYTARGFQHTFAIPDEPIDDELIDDELIDGDERS